MNNLFLKGSTQKVLKIRNNLLIIVQVVLWLALISTGGPVIIQVAFGSEPVSTGLVVTALIILTVIIRFEIWSIDFKAQEYGRVGQNWAITGIKDNPVYQTKFFTFRHHGEGEKNPLW